MQDNGKKPALRFKGFTDPWEQRKLGDLCVEFRSGEFISASDITETGEYPVFGGNGLRGFTDRFNHDGEYTLIGRQGALCGNVNFAVGKSYFTEHAIAVRADKKNQTRFLYYLFSTMDLGQYSGQSAQPGLAVGNLVELKSTLPDKQEQEKISGVLTALDTLITLHQRKYEKLVNIKKSMLDKMFPQNGASVPEIRFKGFTDPWEQRKLAELTKTITTGKSVNSDEGEVSDGDIGVLKTSCVSYDRFNPSESKPVVKSEQQLVKCAVEKDSVIVSRMNTPERVGACGYVSTDFPNLFLPDRLWKLKFQDTVDTYFVYMMLVSSAYKEKITSMASGTSGSMYNIPKETFLNLQLVIPAKIDEQKQLGRILKKIDSLITLHQRKLEKLQNIKKSCLEKMFV